MTAEKLRQVSWLIDQQDFDEIEAMLHEDRKRTGNRRISQGDIARMVVARGVRELRHERNIGISASTESEAVA